MIKKITFSLLTILSSEENRTTSTDPCPVIKNVNTTIYQLIIKQTNKQTSTYPSPVIEFTKNNFL